MLIALLLYCFTALLLIACRSAFADVALRPYNIIYRIILPVDNVIHHIILYVNTFFEFFGENFIIYGTFCNYCHYFRNFIDFFRPNPRLFTELFAVLGITSVILTLFSCSYHGKITELFAVLAITSVIPTLFSCSKLQKLRNYTPKQALVP